MNGADVLASFRTQLAEAISNQSCHSTAPKPLHLPTWKRWASSPQPLVAEHLITRMVHAAKCRAADDLLMTAEQHAELERDRLRLTFRTLE